MIKKVLILSFIVFCTNACLHTTKEKIENYAPMDFMDYNGDLSFSGSSGDGIIYFRCYHGYSDGSENPFGNAQVYMIHKNGGDWWMNKAKELYPDKSYYPLFYANELYESQDSNHMDDYHKWAFYIDKKYLKAETSGGRKRYSLYLLSSNLSHTLIIYEQKAGFNKWVETAILSAYSKMMVNTTIWNYIS